jgi:SNF2 family DNA or RNA helicase
MVSFVCPGLLGPLGAFKKIFAEPIARANERDATPEEKALAQERSAELMSRVEKFMLRRTSSVNSTYLPSLTSYVVFCKLTPLQVQSLSGVAWDHHLLVCAILEAAFLLFSQYTITISADCGSLHAC